MSSIGIKLPITYDTGDGFTMITTIKQMVKQNLKMLILTNPGERVMEPNFGVGVKRFLFSNYSEGAIGKINNRLRQQLNLYLPIVTIVDLQFESQPDTNSIRIVLTYQIPDIGINDLLEITI
mgnify:CR=1 FL=1